MLFNPKWKAPETKTDPHSLEALIAWLETKDPNEAYDFYHANVCLAAQWALHCDKRAHPADGAGIFYAYTINGKVEKLNRMDAVAMPEPWTFGRALERAKALIK